MGGSRGTPAGHDLCGGVVSKQATDDEARGVVFMIWVCPSSSVGGADRERQNVYASEQEDGFDGDSILKREASPCP